MTGVSLHERPRSNVPGGKVNVRLLPNRKLEFAKRVLIVDKGSSLRRLFNRTAAGTCELVCWDGSTSLTGRVSDGDLRRRTEI